ncbi:Exopolysaccharide production protein ExoZ [hydrothermal vent metagenome]|uniref:Exopolysaccharide production protein ExoZ n=1 Tax=hydrothermal vent metagenome TaxID=652676 RepID=A0A3B0RZ07_9ZZZZ
MKLLRLQNIQALRALAVLMVVFVHLMMNERRASEDQILSPLFVYGVSGVDLFFVISGFIMVYISQGKFGSWPFSAQFILERAARIYPPAMLFTALTIVGIVVAGTSEKWLPNNNILFSFLLLPQAKIPLLSVAWTLIHELYFYLVFSVFLLTKPRWLPLWLLLWTGFVLAGNQAGIWPLNPWTKIIFHPLTFEFIAGAVVGLLAIHFKPRWGLGCLLVGAGLFLAGMVWLYPGVIEKFPYGWPRVLAFTPGAALMVYGAFAMEAVGGGKPPKFLIQIGNWSYSLYLSHLLVIATLAHIWMRFARQGVIDNILFVLVAFTAVFVVAVLSYVLFERPILRIAKTNIKRWFHSKSDN